jgi:hypothetical protein
MDERKSLMRDIDTVDRLMTAPLDSLTMRRLERYRTELQQRLEAIDEAVAGLGHIVSGDDDQGRGAG